MLRPLRRKRCKSTKTHNTNTFKAKECGCPSGGGMNNGHIRYPSYGGTQENVFRFDNLICSNAVHGTFELSSPGENEQLQCGATQLLFFPFITSIKNFNRHNSHDHHGSKRRELAQHTHTHMDRTLSLKHFTSTHLFGVYVFPYHRL